MHETQRQERAKEAAKLAVAARSLKHQSGLKAPFSLAFLTDGARTPDPQQTASVLPHGTAVIVRNYDDADRAALASELQTICVARGLILLVGADLSLAKRIGAAGVHLPAWFDGPKQRQSEFIYTAACHSAAELEKASNFGADAALLSPAFSTASHPNKAALGAAAFCKLAAASSLPVLALGGVTADNAHRLAGNNVVGIAAIGAFSR